MAEPESDPQVEPELQPASPATVLLVEDEVPVRQFVRRALELGGYRVVEAASGQDALWILSKYPDSVDLILTDVVMPGMSGRLMADTLANRQSTVKMIFMSGNAELVRVLNGGVMEGDTLLKPFTSCMLLERVRQALEAAEPAPAEQQPARQEPAEDDWSEFDELSAFDDPFE